MLDKLDQWIDEIPPLPTPQRFGNLAFRTWGKRLEEVRQPAEVIDLRSVADIQLVQPPVVRTFNHAVTVESLNCVRHGHLRGPSHRNPRRY